VKVENWVEHRTRNPPKKHFIGSLKIKQAYSIAEKVAKRCERPYFRRKRNR
jgi:hypothetical protein